jgi:AGCS family alanine or glycine:cation symporter
MEFIELLSDLGNRYIVNLGIPVGDETISFMVLLLLGTGVFLTVRLGFIQLRHLGHGFAVTSGHYDDPNEPGDVSHFQALTTALSATVGIGNIAGVAIAIHWGGPGALFWMWVTAGLGMATKYTEVTLAQKYRNLEGIDRDPHKWEGTVSGGPMYYIEKGLGPNWRWMAMLFAGLLGITAFLTGNAIQANTVSDTMLTTFGVPTWMTGLATSAIVAAVILGGITRIGRVTSILAPLMAGIYTLGALTILISNAGEIIPAFGLIFREAFNPTAGVAGTGVGAFLVTMMWGVRRGLFSNEAGQGSAPIAHAAAKTDEPVSEGVVALLEPFIDTIVICTMTALVINISGAYNNPAYADLVAGSQGAALTSRAFGEHIAWFPYVLSIAVFMFAYSTMISWSYYGERCSVWLWGEGASKYFKAVFLLFVFLGSIVTSTNILNFGDLMILGMALPNLIGVYLLSGKVRAALDDYWTKYQAGQFKVYN